MRLHPHTGLKHQLRVHMARVLGGTFCLDFLARSSLLGFEYCRPVSYVFLLSFFFFFTQRIFSVTHCTGAPRPVRWSPHARVFQRAAFFYILRPSPSGCASLFSIVPFFFFSEGAESTVLPSEISPRRAPQAFSFDNFRPSSSGLHRNMPRFKLGFTRGCRSRRNFH